jgi:DNA-binding transcriptional ArsR family regulator
MVDTLELLLHPVRVRIVHAMSGGVTRTTSDMLDRLPDVSKATVYRHVSLLAEAGVLEVVSEQRVHGAVERRYRLYRPRAVIDPDAAASMTLEEHRHGFAAAMAALVAEFNTYLNQGHANPTADKVGYRQIPLWLSQEELAELISQVHTILVSTMDNQPGPGRRLHLLSPILFPIGNVETNQPSPNQTSGHRT